MAPAISPKEAGAKHGRRAVGPVEAPGPEFHPIQMIV